ncbi:MAG: riboflavin synthase [Oscillatoriales cyanobacterium C42_A2020_001]|nr:riboflavin synthase [Leptolyngbyaceae cyanobacterium C42_A2020_001]
MFTGLIQGLGTLQPLATDKVQVTCSRHTAELILLDLALGDSVAVDGICLTVVEILPQGFIAVVSPETRDRSTLSSANHRIVNLETSLRVGSKLGGHFVTGHVDGIGQLESAVETSTSWEMTFAAPPTVARHIISKGSIAINGISLTVATCNEDGSQFTVAVIPHTYRETNLHHLQPGSLVNLEGDILGKYVEKFLRGGLPTTRGDRWQSSPNQPQSLEQLTPSFLAEHGYS